MLFDMLESLNVVEMIVGNLSKIQFKAVGVKGKTLVLAYDE